MKKLLLLLPMAFLFLGFPGSPPPAPQQLCVTIKRGDCFNVYGSTLQLTHRESTPPLWACSLRDFENEDKALVAAHVSSNFSTNPQDNHFAAHVVYLGNVTKKNKNVISSATAQSISTNRIKGKEVNRGWWSKDSKRSYTLEELFLKRFGVSPTPTDIQNMLANGGQLAKQYFHDLHDQPPLWPFDHLAYDIVVYQEEVEQYCGSYNKDNITEFFGTITFPNGEKCRLVNERIEKNTMFPRDPMKILMKVEKPCNSCN